MPGFKLWAYFLISLPLIRQASRRANAILAKDPDHLAASFDAEDTGVLSDFLAEEDEFDRLALWRLGTWGVASVAAVALAASNVRPCTSSRRLNEPFSKRVTRFEMIDSMFLSLCP